MGQSRGNTGQKVTRFTIWDLCAVSRCYLGGVNPHLNIPGAPPEVPLFIGFRLIFLIKLINQFLNNRFWIFRLYTKLLGNLLTETLVLLQH